MLESVGGEAVAVRVGDSLDQAMKAEFSQIVAELEGSIGSRLEGELVQDGGVEFGGGPGAQVAIGLLEKDFQQAHESSVFELDAGDLGVALEHWLGESGDEVQLAVDI